MSVGAVMPLISVVMPVFNAADTLPLALASLQAQTCENWECIVVNDGSTDDPEKIVRAVCDARIQYHSLDRNRGRGYARQCGLEMSRGRYITFLDADDWIYPEKFDEQTNLLEEQSDLALVSTGMAISNARNQLVGLRSARGRAPVIYAPRLCLGMPGFPFAPSMIVADLAKKTGFDTSFPIAEDVDFLMRAVSGQRYAMLDSALYVYREQGFATFSKVNSALDHCCRMFAKRLDQYPLRSCTEIVKARTKQIVYCSAHALGVFDYMIARRSQHPGAEDLQQYRNAWNIVSRVAAGYSAVV
jgi:glycosyltransferase involved in cell wall biosynthesis